MILLTVKALRYMCGFCVQINICIVDQGVSFIILPLLYSDLCVLNEDYVPKVELTKYRRWWVENVTLNFRTWECTARNLIPPISSSAKDRSLQAGIFKSQGKRCITHAGNSDKCVVVNFLWWQLTIKIQFPVKRNR